MENCIEEGVVKVSRWTGIREDVGDSFLFPIAKKAMEIFKYHLIYTLDSHWHFNDELLQEGDSVRCIGHNICLKSFSVAIKGDHTNVLEMTVEALAEMVSGEVKDVSVVAFNDFKIPDHVGLWSHPEGLIVSDGRYSLRLMRQYSHEARCVEITIDALLGTAG